MTDTYANEADLAKPVTVVPVDILDAHLHSFFVAYQTKTRPVSRAVVLASGQGVTTQFAYVYGGSGEVTGISIAETTGTNPATVALIDGNNGPLLMVVSLAAGQSANINYTPPVRFESTLWMTVKGYIAGVAYVADTIAL